MALYASIAWSANPLVLDVDKKSQVAAQCRADINKAANQALDQQKKAQQKLNKKILAKINAEFNAISNQFYNGLISYEQLSRKLGQMLTNEEIRALKEDEKITHDEIANVYKKKVKSSHSCKKILFSNQGLNNLYNSYLKDIPSKMTY